MSFCARALALVFRRRVSRGRGTPCAPERGGVHQGVAHATGGEAVAVGVALRSAAPEPTRPRGDTPLAAPRPALRTAAERTIDHVPLTA